jgi:predicted ATPase
MYLASLREDAAHTFSDFFHSAFGATVSTQQEAKNISIMLKEADSSREMNLVDLGYGYSQLLPVAAQLYATLNARESRFRTPWSSETFRVVAIEQPELHLHPAFQARLADLFTGCVTGRASLATTGKQRDVRVLAETHSEALVNRLGELVETGRLQPDEVVIYMFERPEPGGPTYIGAAEFNDSAELVNWPAGFFSSFE